MNKGIPTKGTPRQIMAALLVAVPYWTEEEKAAARASLNRWHASTIWEAENPGRPYSKESQS